MQRKVTIMIDPDEAPEHQLYEMESFLINLTHRGLGGPLIEQVKRLIFLKLKELRFGNDISAERFRSRKAGES